MEIEKIDFDIEIIEQYLEELPKGEFKNIVGNYYNGIEQALLILTIPYYFMVEGYSKAKLEIDVKEKALSLSKEDFHKKMPPKEMAEYLVNYFDKKLQVTRDESLDLSSEHIKLILERNSKTRETYQQLAMNSIINSWTIFEAISMDTWKYILNNYPQKFLHNVLKSTNGRNGSFEGVNGKQISIGVLGKYNFDVSNHLGDLLAPKYDFTSVTGIKIAFQDLLKLNKEDLKFLENKKISQLEITRHLMVHNSGIIDEDYLRRSSRQNENLKEKLHLPPEEINEMINSSILCMKEIFTVSRQKLEEI